MVEKRPALGRGLSALIPDSPAPAPPPAPAPAPAPAVAPSNAVQVNFTRSGLNENVNVTNTADLAGQCTYNANDVNGILPPAHRDFGIGAKGNAQLSFPAPPPLSTYHVVVSCHGTFNGQDVEFGHVERDVSG